MAKILNFHDFECSTCGLPSEPGECSHCRISPFSRALQPGSPVRHYFLLAGLAMMAITVFLFSLLFSMGR